MKYISISLTIFTLLLASILVLLSTRAKKTNKMFSLFGYSYSVVVTNSMDPDIKVGELILIKKVNYEKYLQNAKVNEDVVVYYSSMNKRFIVHQLYEINGSNLRLKGVNNDAPDLELVDKDNFQGIVVSHGFRSFGLFLLSSRPIIVLILLVFLIFISISEVISAMLRKNKEEIQKQKEIQEQLRKEVLEEIKKEQNHE